MASKSLPRASYLTSPMSKLPESVKGFINAGQLSAGHARALLGQADPEAMARDIIERGLNVRQVEALAQEQQARPVKATKRRGVRKHADTVALERRLSDALGLAVDIEHRGKGGVLRIRYRDVEQLDEVVKRLERRS